MHRPLVAAVVAAILIPSTSFAAGYEYPDNTARALARGAAYVASGDDPALIQYNPAGLANVSGLRLSLNTHFVYWNTEYQRLAEVDGEFTATDPLSGVTMQPVQNLNNPWFAPFISASYQIIDGLTVGVGLFGPSAFGERSYTDPRDVAPFFWDGEYEEEEEQALEVQENIPAQAPQRFGLIRQATRVIFPSLAVAYEPTPWLRVGATGQLIYASTEFSLAFRSGTLAGLLGQGPQSEIIGELDVATPSWGFTGIIGAQVMPMEQLTIGLAVRPGFSTRSEGDLNLYFNDMQAEFLGLEQGRNGAVFETSFPTIIRFGAAWEQDGWLVELGGNYEMLSTVQAFRITPDITIESGGTPLITVSPDDGPLDIEKQWRDTFSIRLGGGADLQRVAGLPLPLEVYAGYVYERSAIPTNTQNLDFIAPNRNQVTTGLSLPIGPVRATAAYSRIFEPTVRVRDSIVPLIDDAALAGEGGEPIIVGNGDYRSQHDIFVFALEGRFGGAW
jgi:long-subunit fatty acid transport protein